MTPRGGPFFWPQVYNLNKLGRGPLDDATYQIPRLDIVVSSKIVSCFHYISLCKTCDPRGGPYWPQEYNFNKCGGGP